jgi:hypothetical protein
VRQFRLSRNVSESAGVTGTMLPSRQRISSASDVSRVALLQRDNG